MRKADHDTRQYGSLPFTLTAMASPHRLQLRPPSTSPYLLLSWLHQWRQLRKLFPEHAICRFPDLFRGTVILPLSLIPTFWTGNQKGRHLEASLLKAAPNDAPPTSLRREFYPYERQEEGELNIRPPFSGVALSSLPCHVLSCVFLNGKSNLI